MEFDLVNAVSLQKRATQLNRLNGETYWELGNYLVRAGHTQEALIQYERAVQNHRTSLKFRQSRDHLKRVIASFSTSS